jgi:putative endonuclease
VGSCLDMQRRLHEHNIGHSKFTSTGIPWQIMHIEVYESESEAKQREAYIKKQKSRKYIETLIGRASRF